MRKIGHIVTDKDIKGVKPYVSVGREFNNDGVPSLIIGLKKAKECIDGFNILEKNPSDGIYWTFSKTEMRSDYEDDIIAFYGNIVKCLSERVKYYYVNPFKLSFEQAKKLVRILFSNDDKYIYINGGMLYCLYNGNVLGISIDVARYIGIDVEKALSRIRSNPRAHVYDNESKVVMTLRRDFVNKGYAYLVPYLLSEE